MKWMNMVKWKSKQKSNKNEWSFIQKLLKECAHTHPRTQRNPEVNFQCFYLNSFHRWNKLMLIWFDLIWFRSGQFFSNSYAPFWLCNLWGTSKQRYSFVQFSKKKHTAIMVYCERCTNSANVRKCSFAAHCNNVKHKHYGVLLKLKKKKSES